MARFSSQPTQLLSFLLAAREFATMICCTPLYTCRQAISFHAALSEWNQEQAQKKTDDLVRGRSTMPQMLPNP
jgi:hypothetical protein